MTTATPIHHPRPIRLRIMRVMLAAAALAAVPVAAGAQDAAAEEARLRKIEAEVRALQRKVFPGGDGKFFEPQIAPGTQAPAPATGTGTASAPAATAVTDILVRLDALEQQLQALTARSEEQANTMAQLEVRLAALETAGAAPAVAAGTLPASTLPSAPTLAAVTPAATTSRAAA